MSHDQITMRGGVGFLAYMFLGFLVYTFFGYVR